MAYDPQANRRRPKPADEDSAPVEALLGGADEPEFDATDPTRSVPEDPPPQPSVTPAPADPPSDALLLNTTLATAIGAVLGLLVLRHFWRRHRANAQVDPAN